MIQFTDRDLEVRRHAVHAKALHDAFMRIDRLSRPGEWNLRQGKDITRSALEEIR